MRGWLVLFEVVGVGAVVGGVLLRRWFDRRRRARRLLGRTRSTPIGQLVDGDMASVSGTAVALGPLQPSPFDPRGCIAFRVTVESTIRNDPANGFRDILARESCQPFSISDETGIAVIEGPFLIELDVDDSSWTDLPPAVFTLLEGAGIVPSPTDVLRYRSALLFPGDRVTVMGRVRTEIHPQGERQGFRDPPIRRRIMGTNESPVVLRDADQDP